jgi:cell division protein FtsL
MKKLGGFYLRLNPTCQVFLLAALVLSLTALATMATAAAATPQLMFVQSAEDLKVDAAKNTFRLVKVNQQTLYFADRPDRLAGHLKMADYLKEWTAAAGKDNFKADPPNATLSVYEPGKSDNTIVVVTLTNPVVDGADLVYNYKVINGKMPAKGGATALFIDWIGVGGGVGPGFHGVGVGRRGVGWR